jgi:hypothetical protein
MSEVWNKMIACSDAIIKRFEETGERVEEPGIKRFDWINHVYTSNGYRRAHIDIVDARDTKKLWMMHCCIFPHTNDPSPIFGFDVIAGPNKVSGAFHDFSNAGEPTHPMMQWFDSEVSSMNWKKERQLPEWAQAIFSPAMVAIGAVNTNEELDQLITLSLRTLDYYLDNVGKTQQDVASFHEAQNFYCRHQKQNPHTPRVMTSLGLNEDDVRVFIDQILFPEIG